MIVEHFLSIYNNHTNLGDFPANIHLDERLQDTSIVAIIFMLVIRFQKTSSRRLQDFLVKTNMFVLVIPLQHIFKTSRQLIKTSARRLVKTSSRHLRDILPRYLQDVFKTSSKGLSKTSQERF